MYYSFLQSTLILIQYHTQTSEWDEAMICGLFRPKHLPIMLIIAPQIFCEDNEVKAKKGGYIGLLCWDFGLLMCPFSIL